MPENEPDAVHPVNQQNLSSDATMEALPISTSPTTFVELYQKKEKPKQRGKYICIFCGFFFSEKHVECPNCKKLIALMLFKDYIKSRSRHTLQDVDEWTMLTSGLDINEW